MLEDLVEDAAVLFVLDALEDAGVLEDAAPLDDAPLDDDALDELEPAADALDGDALDDALSDDPPPEDPPPDDPPSEEPGFEDAYRSLYQPPPLSWNDVSDISFASVPPLWHLGHSGGGGSPCF